MEDNGQVRPNGLVQGRQRQEVAQGSFRHLTDSARLTVAGRSPKEGSFMLAFVDHLLPPTNFSCISATSSLLDCHKIPDIDGITANRWRSSANPAKLVLPPCSLKSGQTTRTQPRGQREGVCAPGQQGVFEVSSTDTATYASSSRWQSKAGRR